MKISDLTKISLSNIGRKKIQTFLTSIGIAIGVSLIFILISVSKGLEYTVKSQFEKLGSDTIIITAGKATNIGIPILSLRGVRSAFSETVIDKIKNANNVKYILPLGRSVVELRYGEETITTVANIVPTEYANNLEYFGFSLSDGRFFNLKDGKKCLLIIGKAIHNSIFSSKKIDIGDTLYVDGKRCTIIGILSSTGNFLIDYGIFIPYEFYKFSINANFSGFSQIYVKLENYDLGYENILKILDKEFGKDYSVITMEFLYQTISSTIETISTFALLLSLISIIVSAVGVANTMFSSVIERKKEIGILKALGMRNINILEMFLLEAAIIGAFAGLFGIITGVIGAKIFEYIYFIYGYSFRIYLGIDLFLIAFIIPITVGIVAGFAPAYQASKIDPIEILKSE